MKNILSKMHIQEHTEKLAKGVSKEIKFKLGNRDATLFTKSPEYGQLLDNNHINHDLIQQDIKRAMRTAFVESFTIGSDADSVGMGSRAANFGENADVFEDAVDPEEEQQANDDAAREEINRQEREREDQRQRMAEHVRRQTDEMFDNIPTPVDRNIREASRAQASGLLRNVYHNALVELEARNRRLRQDLKLEGKDRSQDFDTKSVDFQNEAEQWAQAQRGQSQKRTRQNKQKGKPHKNARQIRTQARVTGQKKELAAERARIAGEEERANEFFETKQMGREDINMNPKKPPPKTEAEKEAALREKQQRERLTNRNTSSSSSSGAARVEPTGPNLQQIRDFLETLYHNHQLLREDSRGYELLAHSGPKAWQLYKSLDAKEKAEADKYLKDMYARYRRRFPNI